MSETTGPALGFVAECPELATLEQAPLAPRIVHHVEVCESCQLVLELLAAGAADDCVRFEPLLAARADGANGRAAANLLARHLASCDGCRAVADTLSPTADAQGDHDALPRIAPESYEIGLEIGKGGMGRVFAARDLRIGRPVAVKELLGRSQQLAARFEREARITARLQHPGIVPIYEIGRWPDGTPFYSMRIIEGDTLRKAITAATTLAERLVLLPAVIAATEAVAFAHAQRIIHRDLTPSNVLVGAYGETVVIDWGLAKDVSEGHADDPYAGPYRGEGAQDLTGVGAVVGTAAYMPPEQAKAEPVAESADVYALGAILYHLLAGKPPYTTHERVLDAVKAGPPAPIDEVAPAAPRDLVSIVGKAMAREPDARYPSARELAEELKRFQAGRMVEAHEYTTGERMRRFVVRNRAPLVVTGIALVVLFALGFVAVRRIVRARTAAERTVRAQLEEAGRVELLKHEPVRALAYFEEAVANGAATPALAFMRAQALREISSAQTDLDCGGAVRDIDFSRDGTILYASCHDVAKAWRLADRVPLATFTGGKGGFDHMELSHDGTIVVTFGDDGDARLWDARTNTLLRTLRHAADTTITFATFTADDSRLATTGYDGWARIWDVRTGALVRAIQASDAPVFHHLYGPLSRDGKILLTFTIEGIGAGWDVATGAKIGEVEHGDYGMGGDLSPDGTRAATCGLNRLVKIWATSAPRMIVQLPGATDAVVACKFSADSTRVLGVSQDGHAFVWDIASGQMIAAVDHGHALWTGHFSPDGSRFVTVAVGKIKVWDTASGGLLATHDTQGGTEARFSPDGTLLIAGRGDGRIRIWSNPSGPLQAALPVPPHAYSAVSDDGRRALVEIDDGWLALRDTATGAVIATPKLRYPVSAAGDRVAAKTAGDRVAVLDAATGTTIATLPIERMPDELALTGDGHHIAIGYGRGAAEVWDVERAVRLATLDGAHHVIASDTARVALGWSDGAPRAWNLATGASIALPVTGEFRPIGFSRDGGRVVLEQGALGAPHTVSVWDTTDGRRVSTIDGVNATPLVDPGGTYVTAMLADHSVQTFELAGDGHLGFHGDLLQQAQIDPSGHLIAGIDDQGAAILVLDARDGRVLVRWPLAHDPPHLRQDGFDPPRGTVRWSRDGKNLVAQSNRIERWNTDTELRDPRGALLDPPRIAQLVRHNVAWHVVAGTLVPALATLHGRLVRDGVALAHATLQLVFRKPADLGAGAVTWEAAAFQNKALPPLETDANGAFSREQLAPGRYTITIVAGGATRTLDRDIDVEDDALNLDLAR